MDAVPLRMSVDAVEVSATAERCSDMRNCWLLLRMSMM